MIQEALYKVTHDQDLSYDLAKDTMNKIMSGDVAEVPMAGFLCALAAKGPTVDEVTAFAEVMREKAGSVPHEQTVVEIVGTGGDEANTFNISTTSGFIISAAGIPVAKHGNRSVSSKCGAADLIEALGAKLELNGEQNEAVLNKANMCFMFAPVYHQAMKYAGPVRKALGVRTVFNILGPLANPAGATVELMGVYDKSLVEPLAHVLATLVLNVVLLYTALTVLMKLQLLTKRTYAKLIMALSQVTNLILKNMASNMLKKLSLKVVTQQ